MYYYSNEQAEELKNKFEAWIGKKAHVGSGRTEILKQIHILSKKSRNPFTKNRKLFRVSFEFENKRRISANRFLQYNSQQFSKGTTSTNQYTLLFLNHSHT